MVIELSVGSLLTLLGIPTAITAFCSWMLQRRIAKREAIQDAREAAREQNEVLLIQKPGQHWRWQRPPPWLSSASLTPIVMGICTPLWNMPARSSTNRKTF